MGVPQSTPHKTDSSTQKETEVFRISNARDPSATLESSMIRLPRLCVKWI